jgi:hypothetical protein
MREELVAAIERAFINLHYARAELEMRGATETEMAPAIDHINQAMRELQLGLERAPEPTDLLPH